MSASSFASVGRVVALVMALASIPACNASSATRILPDGPFLCGESYIISIAVDLDDGTRSWGIDETVPTGWQPTLPTQGGRADDSGHVKWFKFSQAGDGLPDTTVRYFLYIPKWVVGDASFPAAQPEGGFNDGSGKQEIGGDQSLSVSCASPAPMEEESSGGGSSSFFAGFSPIWLVLILAVVVLGVIWIVRGRLPKE